MNDAAGYAFVAETPLGRALRSLQILDQVHDLGEHRYLLVRAQDGIAGVLGLDCTGKPSMFGIDELVVDGYDHSTGTCPVHEWLVPADCPEGT